MERSRCGYTGGYIVLQGPNLGFPCSYVLNKPKQLKITLLEPHGEKAIGVDRRGLGDKGFDLERTPGAGIKQKLACGPIIYMCTSVEHILL